MKKAAFPMREAAFRTYWDFFKLLFGGVEGDRTLDLRIANATLSQLSYNPEPVQILYKFAPAHKFLLYSAAIRGTLGRFSPRNLELSDDMLLPSTHRQFLVHAF